MIVDAKTLCVFSKIIVNNFIHFIQNHIISTILFSYIRISFESTIN